MVVESRSLRQRIATGTLWAAAASGGRDAISFAIFIVLARLLPPEAFGLVAMAMIVVGLGQLVVDGSVNEALIQRKELEAGHLDAAFWVLLSLAGTLMLVLWGSADLLAALFDQPQVTPLARWLSVTLLLGALSAVPIALLTRQLRFRVLAARSLAAVTVGGSVGVAMAGLGYGVWSLVGFQLSQRLTELVVLWTVSDWRPGFRGSWRHLRELRAYALNVIGVRLIGFVDQQVPRILIGYFLGPTALGYFALSWRIFEFLMTLLAAPLDTVAMPVFARLQGDLARVHKMLVSGTQLSSLIALPSFVGLAIVAPEFITEVMGTRWSPTIPILQLLALTGIAYSLMFFISPLVRALGRPDWLLWMMLLGTTLSSAVMPLVSQWGLVAVTLVLLARAYLLLPLYLYAARRLTGFDVLKPLRALLTILSATLVMAIAVEIWRRLTADVLALELVLATSIVFGIAVYGGMVLLVARQPVLDVIDLIRLTLQPHKESTPTAKTRAAAAVEIR